MINRSFLFTFTSIDLKASYTPPTVTPGGATLFTYNKDRQLKTIVRPDGRNVAIGYDTAGRFQTMTIARGTYAASWNATSGVLDSLAAPDGGAVSFVYDGALLTEEDWTGEVAGSISWSYDNDFAPTSETVGCATSSSLACQSISFGYDSDKLLTSAGALTLTRDTQNGGLTDSSVGVVTDHDDYNTFGERSAYTASVSGSPLFTQQFTRDARGRITTKSETVDGVTTIYGYTYDTTGRLTDVTTNGVTTAHYTYDANGNRQTKTTSEGTETATTDAQDRLVTYAGATYTYNANGDLATKTDTHGTTTYSYDELGNLLHVTLPDGTQIDYVIDAQNHRVGKKVNGTLVRRYLWTNSLRIAAELDANGDVAARFVYATRLNVPDLIVKGDTTYRVISDHLGSPRLIVNSDTGEVVERMDFDEFGILTNDTNPGFQPFGFAGGLYDGDTTLLRFGARDYDPATGRFVSKDPMLFSGGDTNLYGYVIEDPINLIDPAGADWVDTTANVSAGIGDALLLGYGDELRAWTDRQFGWGGGALVDRCSGSYRVSTGVTSAAVLALGTARIGYAAGAKGIALGAETAEEAVATRNALKVAGRFGLNQTARVYSVDQILSKYGSAEEAIAAAGRTNGGFNSAGALAIGGAISNLLNQPECGCR